MYKITMANEKGGVGKTSLSVHIAAGLAARGKNVMLVDCDAQGHSTIMWGIKKAPGLYDLIVRDAEFNDVTVLIPPEKYGIPGERLPSGKLYLLPSNVETRNIATSVSDVGIIGARFEELHGTVDYVIFDTSPTPSLLHGAIFTATDGIIYPTRPEVWAFDGLVEAWGHTLQANKFRSANYKLPSIKVLGIVPTMVEKQTVEHSENLEKLNSQFGERVWNPIPKRIIWTETTKYNAPLYTLDPNHDAAGDVWELIDKVEEVTTHVQV